MKLARTITYGTAAAFVLSANASADTHYNAKPGCEIWIYEDAFYAGGYAILKGDVNNFGGNGDLNHMFFMPALAPAADADLSATDKGLKGLVLGQKKINDNISSYRVTAGKWLFCENAGYAGWCDVTEAVQGQGSKWVNNPRGKEVNNLSTIPYVNDEISSMQCTP